MTAFAIAAIILTTVGHLWFAYEVWEREDLIWALLLLLVPFPLLGLYIWFRAGWDSCYRKPALIYFAGYALALVTRVA
jgi:hypothetical protein